MNTEDTFDFAPPTMTVITETEVSQVITSDRSACVDVVRRGYLAHHVGDSRLPHSSFLRFPEKQRERIIALPAYLGGEFDVSGIKWISSFPENTGRGLPRASAVLVLNDNEHGFPFACMEGSVISSSRTAASAVLGAELLMGERRAGRVSFVGTGLIADTVRAFLHDLGWQVDDYRLFDVDRAAAERFAAKIDGVTRVVDTPQEAFEGADLVVIATVATQPHLDDPTLLANAPVVLHLSLRDLVPELVLASQNFTDDVDHALREGTSLNLAEKQTGNRDFVDGTIADLLNGSAKRDPGRAAVFAPFGLGVLDLAVGKLVYDQVIARGGGTVVPGFFGASAN